MRRSKSTDRRNSQGEREEGHMKKESRRMEVSSHKPRMRSWELTNSKNSPLKLSEAVWPCKYLHLRLPAFRTVWEQISVVYKLPRM